MRAPVLLSATVFAALLLLIASCKKEEAPATPVERLDFTTPNRYNPTYPGSWWKYVRFAPDSSVLDTFVVSIDPATAEFHYWVADDGKTDNRLYKINCTMQSGRPYLSDRIIYNYTGQQGGHILCFETFLDTVATSWTFSFPGESDVYTVHTGYHAAFDVADTVQNVIYTSPLRIHCTQSSMHNPNMPSTDRWYAPDVGLIKTVSYDSFDELIDYHINH